MKILQAQIILGVNMDVSITDKIIIICAVAALLFVVLTVAIVGIQAENVINEVHKQIDVMWSEIEIVRDQTYSIYQRCDQIPR